MPIQPTPTPKTADPFASAPAQVEVVRVLGKGRAAVAQLVDAHFEDGRTVRCVEKVFAPGLLTRLIYRLSFWSGFGYQVNRDAIRACYFRRRVAASVLDRAGVAVRVAAPLYVRYDSDAQGWVLAAEYVSGRGVRPAKPGDAHPEIDQLVALMHQAKEALIEAGLSGSGWQIDPRAMVSTANLLRVGNQYTIVDLESGIPAVLVPRYLWLSGRTGTLPPFDDLNASKVGQLDLDCREDINALLDSTKRWKESEPAPLRVSTWAKLVRKVRRKVSRAMDFGRRIVTQPRFQTLVGKRTIRKSILSWQRDDRMSAAEAQVLHREINGREVAAYARGLALHLTIKSLSPLVIPAKFGGLAAAITTGNLWFLTPWLILPLARTLVTLCNWFSSGRDIPHGHALVFGCLPTIGSLAFPVQLLAKRRRLSAFLIRDAVSRVGRRLPIYGGKDSRVEIALIQRCDQLLHAFGIESSERSDVDQGDLEHPVADAEPCTLSLSIEPSNATRRVA